MDIKHLNPKAQKIVVGNKYILKDRLGGGSFGQIYSASNNNEGNTSFAVKLEKRLPNNYTTLAREAKVISDLKDVIGFPTLYDLGREENFSYMTIDLLGYNLEKLFKLCHFRFSLKTVLMLANQMLSRIEMLHNRNYLHRDIKPENFCMGIGHYRKTLYLIDFGLARYYKDMTGKHIPMRENKGLVGTARYASLNAHMGNELGRRDDLEGIGYTLIYLLKGSLPWQNLKAQTKTEKYQLIKEKKMNISVENLCKGLPTEFVTYMNYVKGLGFTDTPNYKYLKKLFKNLLIRSGFELDYQYDWLCKLNPATIRKPEPQINLKDLSAPEDSKNNSPLAGDLRDNLMPRAGFRELVEVNLQKRSSCATISFFDDEASPKLRKVNNVIGVGRQKFMDHIKKKNLIKRSKSQKPQSKMDCTTSYHSSKALNFTIANPDFDVPAEVSFDNTPGDKIEQIAPLKAKRKDFSYGAISGVFNSKDSIELPEGVSLAGQHKKSSMPSIEPTSIQLRDSGALRKSNFHRGRTRLDDDYEENLSESSIGEWKDGKNLSQMLNKQQFSVMRKQDLGT